MTGTLTESLAKLKASEKRAQTEQMGPELRYPQAHPQMVIDEPVSYRTLIPAFLQAMDEIGKYGFDKYGDNSFEARARKGDHSRGDMERTKPEEIGKHAHEHFNAYLRGEKHDHFGTLIHQLAAAAFNCMMESHFANLAAERSK